MPFTYEYPHPAVAADIAVFSLRGGALSLLLIERGAEPFLGMWALPGGFLSPQEDLEDCAKRELLEETGVAASILLHFGNFSAPGRDPRDRVISVAYLALMSSDRLRVRADSDAAKAAWFPIDELPTLAFDHTAIVEAAWTALRRRVRDIGILTNLLDSKFTLGSLQSAYETVMGEAVEKRNFRKMVAVSGAVVETDEFLHGAHRPARLYTSTASA